MGHQTISPPGFEAGRRRAERIAKRGRRFLLIAVVLSVCVHLAAALLVVLLPRILPKDAKPQEQGTVELLMVEQKGSQASQGGQPKDNTPPPAPPEKAEPPKPPEKVDTPKPPEQTEAPKVEEPKDEPVKPPSKTQPTPPTPVPGDEPAPPPTESAEPKAAEANPQPAPQPVPATQQAPAPQPAPATPPQPPAPRQARVQPAPPQSQEAPVFDLSGTDSESNAIVMGGRVIPAMKDDRFRNRPPAYPVEAQMRGEHGEVTLLIHVSEDGVTSGVDVLESSGFDVLDQAAVTAVRKWHFRPAIKEGRPVPFDMPFRFVYEPY
jgi:periplasmic protein TonB